jgi:hypothetical protein
MLATAPASTERGIADQRLRRVRSVLVAMACASMTLLCAVMAPADLVGPRGDWFGGAPPLLCFELVAILDVAVAVITVLAPLCDARTPQGRRIPWGQ